jgi:metallophosphoesterase (TIGR00282 family)
MKILIIGDIVGNSGVKKVKEAIPNFIKQNNIDFTIANGENSADGMGITLKIFEDLKRSGVNIVTMGNHTWGKKEIFNFIDDTQIVRPANYPDGVPGQGYRIQEANGKKIAVINLMGRVDIGVLTENPFLKVDKILEQIKDKADIIIVDFHAEATAEKIAMGYYLDGRVTTVFGTHTHVQTADETILQKGTGYITDIGMTGPRKSVIGMNVEASIKRFVTTLPERYKVSDDKEVILTGCVLDINDETCRIEKISRIKL